MYNILYNIRSGIDHRGVALPSIRCQTAKGTITESLKLIRQLYIPKLIERAIRYVQNALKVRWIDSIYRKAPLLTIRLIVLISCKNKQMFEVIFHALFIQVWLSKSYKTLAEIGIRKRWETRHIENRVGGGFYRPSMDESESCPFSLYLEYCCLFIFFISKH